ARPGLPASKVAGPSTSYLHNEGKRLAASQSMLARRIPSLTLPTHADPDRAIQRMAVAEVIQSRLRLHFAIHRVASIGPVQRAAQAEAAPQPLVTCGEVGTGHDHARTVAEGPVQIGDGVQVRGDGAVRTLVSLTIVDRYAETSCRRATLLL